MPLNEERKEKILDLLARAARADSSFRQFGSSGHKYRLNSPAREDRVRSLEDMYDFKLPEDYFWFITQVGNGGAGPGYGLYQFGDVVDHDEFSYIRESPLMDPSMSQEAYSEFISDHFLKMKNSSNAQETRHLYLQLQQGLLLIGTRGMTSDMFIVIARGENRGRVLFSDIDNRPSLGEFPNFVDWYENWLELTIEKYSREKIR